ncbi:formylmethanofuran--tetrahydromethanopterin N-formyltransferase [Bythopirellula polymerisocia]|uniref:Formylmethanofuran--tetrahydromethanopterin formyltransferase n=1 Tax=Bythopirellula polymerisocia TaxID=2528003 RepID=A0A5C6CZM8_9BACT|nr:formylmethanofuran--tetrahydromethanopterin N-formyltransferase [Bythopirellula polymerisocia]TWU29385.1 Formyltransferase/hydrolase complex subunit D [Bythopirellula polymerisocia]
MMGHIMLLGPTEIVDTFAEAFRMRYLRLIITTVDEYWLDAAVREVTGYGSSVIGCDAEIAVEQLLDTNETPDGRPGASVLAFGFSVDALAKAIPNRVGQCLMTCPTTAVYNGLPEAEEQIPLGKFLRFFGDGFQKSKVLGERRYWRVPVMDGEFVVEEQVGVAKGVAGGNIILQAITSEIALSAARRAVEALAPLKGVITPFPGGVVRSGSKVGSKYKGMVASTNDAFCPTLRGRVETKLFEGANCGYEIVIDGIDEQAVARAMTATIHAAAGEGVLAISAGNYGGKLGKFHFHLLELLKD